MFFGVQRASASQALSVSFIFFRLCSCIASPTIRSFERGGPSTAAVASSRRPSSIQLQAVILPPRHFESRMSDLSAASRVFIPRGLRFKPHAPNGQALLDIASSLQGQLSPDPDTLKYIYLGPATATIGGVSLAMPIQKASHVRGELQAPDGRSRTYEIALMTAFGADDPGSYPRFDLHGVARVSTRLPLFHMIQSSGNRGYVFSLRQVLASLADVPPESPSSPRIP
ncbi:uncharacterized protein UTRI_06231_B [Ustilago trichophora]|uniref:Uncharacterized protein n=1 Tax=Ustilago trichophora TaxID=86804 RepID=A0A5C3EIP7_9BASI|nr:uncharacterized protein UTRI_06231_B [Ustilago trichophora]